MRTSPTRWQTGATLAILVLSTISSLLGLFREGHYTDSVDSLLRMYAQDAVLLGIGVPVLAIGLLYIRRGSHRGRLIWLGTLAYMAYMWIHYALIVAYNDFFLGYIALVGLSVFTLVSGVISTDAEEFSRAIPEGFSERLYGGFLTVAAVGLALMWLADIVPARLAGELPSGIVQLGSEAAFTYVLDLSILVPCLAISGIWLLRHRPWGYVTAGTMLVFTALFAPTLTAITVVDLTEGVEISLPILVGTIVPPLIGVAFGTGYLRALDA